MKKYAYSLFCLVFAISISSAAFASGAISLIADKAPDAPFAHGLKYLEKTIKSEGYTIAAPGDKSAALTIIIGDMSKNAELKSKIASIFKTQLPAKAESFVITSTGKTIYAGGADAVGAMYAAYDVAEQLEINGAAKLPAALNNKSYQPLSPIRAVNPFFHVDAFQDQNSWYYDDEYWATYLDELSLDRINVIDIHAMYELISTFFPNCYLYLLYSDNYPSIGVGKTQAEKNLAQFKKIVQMAKDRGIKTSLMSYHASYKLTSADKMEEPGDEELAGYTSEMVAKLVKEVPDLFMTGFRIGESGRSEDFFTKSYLKGLDMAGKKINMFTRSWLASPALVRSIAEAYPGLFVEIKYNGEQLGLPYHAMTINRKGDAPSYTWEDYTNYPRKYEIYWQIRANGTHRLFRWGDPVFAGRVARSVRFGNSIGYTMEPMISYYPPTDFFHKNHSDYDYFKWDHQRNWFWYMVWGRMTYDDKTPENVWLNRFEKHYGAKAAKPAYDTVVWMSRIVPLIYSYRCLGPDHRNMAPEYETGGTLNEFGNNLPLDPDALRQINEYVRWKLFDGDMTDAKLGPFGVADLLDEYAANANDAAEKAKGLVPKGNKEFEDLLIELNCLSHLARYYSAKIRAATYLSFFKEKSALEDLDAAKRQTAAAHKEWAALAATGDKYYQPILDTLRMRRYVNGNSTFRWSDLTPLLKDDLKDIDAAEKDFNRVSGQLWHRPVWRGPAAKPFVIKATLATGEITPTLSYRHTGASDWKKIAMKPSSLKGVFEAAIPAAEAKGDVEYFISAGDLRTPSGKAVKTVTNRFSMEDYADNSAKEVTKELDKVRAKSKVEFYTLHFKSESEPPVISFEKVQVVNKGKQAKFVVRAKDSSKVAKVILRYKEMPTYKLWQSMPMKQTSPGVFEAEVPLTPEGILYAVNAADEHGNSTAYPDFLKETPYRWIDAWDPAKNPYN